MAVPTTLARCSTIKHFSFLVYRYGFNGMGKDNDVKGEGNSYDFGARIYDSRLGRWLATDPLARNYVSWSCYNFTMNNPVLFVDKDGREVYIHGSDALKAFAALQKKTSLQLSYDVKTGQVTAMGQPKSKQDKELLTAIQDEGTRVNLITTTKTQFTSQDGGTYALLIGAYDGSRKTTEFVKEQDAPLPDGLEVPDDPISEAQGPSSDGNVEKKEIIETIQYINIDDSEKAEKAGVSDQASDVFHEIMESYYGAKIDPGGKYSNSVFNQAHKKAMSLDPAAAELDVISSPKNKEGGLRNRSNGNSVILRP